MSKNNKHKDSNKQKKKQETAKLILLIVLLIILIAVTAVLIVFQQKNKNKEDENTLAYTELIKEIQNKNVEEIEMTVGSTTLKVKLKEVEEEKKAIIPNTQVFMELIQNQALEGNEIK